MPTCRASRFDTRGKAITLPPVRDGAVRSYVRVGTAQPGQGEETGNQRKGSCPFLVAVLGLQVGGVNSPEKRLLFSRTALARATASLRWVLGSGKL